MTRKALGKGLSALLPELPAPAPPSPTPSAPIQDAAIGDLEPNPAQPRHTFDAALLDELAASIRESGIVQPILVRRRGSRFQIVAGERRWRAAQRAGLARVPVTVRDVPDERLLQVALIENIQREELTPIEEAQAYQRLLDASGETQEQVARRVGKDRSTVANALRLLRLPREIQDLVENRKLDAGHARALLALETVEAQVDLAREAARRGLAVREVEQRVALARAPRTARTARRKDANTAAAEERLRTALGTQVKIARRGKGGVLQIRFASEDELNRLYEALLRAGRGR
jgi:ParB family chromosome partitioning protein